MIITVLMAQVQPNYYSSFWSLNQIKKLATKLKYVWLFQIQFGILSNCADMFILNVLFTLDFNGLFLILI